MNVLIEAPERRANVLRHGTGSVVPMQDQSTPACSIDGCDRLAYVRGWCTLHYRRWHRTGDPLARKWDGWPDAMTRFWSKVDKSGDCWLWTGTKTRHGYGQFTMAHGGVPEYAHRIAYQSIKGAIPTGLHLDHLCRTRACVNPDHLEAVTPAENIRRGDTGKGQARGTFR